MQPSRSSLDRLPKVLLPHWAEQRVTWEAQLRTTETVPAAAQVLSMDGVMAPIRGGDKREQAKLPGKQASGPTGYKEVCCGTVTLYDQAAERLQTVRYARMPEHKKATLQQQLATEVATVLALNPELQPWCAAWDRSPPSPSTASTAGHVCDSRHTPGTAGGPSCVANHRTASPDTARQSAASTPGSVPTQPPAYHSNLHDSGRAVRTGAEC